MRAQARLSPPNGYRSFFDWASYLEETTSVPAPPTVFKSNSVFPSYKGDAGIKFELWHRVEAQVRDERDMTHSYVPWLIHVWHDTFIGSKFELWHCVEAQVRDIGDRIHSCDMTEVCDMTQVCDMTKVISHVWHWSHVFWCDSGVWHDSDVWHDSGGFTCVTLISRVWRDSGVWHDSDVWHDSGGLTCVTLISHGWHDSDVWHDSGAWHDWMCDITQVWHMTYSHVWHNSYVWRDSSGLINVTWLRCVTWHRWSHMCDIHLTRVTLISHV